MSSNQQPHHHPNNQLGKLNLKTQNLSVFQLPPPNLSSSISNIPQNATTSPRRPPQLVQHQTFNRGIQYYANSHMNNLTKLQIKSNSINNHHVIHQMTTIQNHQNNNNVNYHHNNHLHQQQQQLMFPNSAINSSVNNVNSRPKVKLPQVSNSITITNVQGPAANSNNYPSGSGSSSSSGAIGKVVKQHNNSNGMTNKSPVKLPKSIISNHSTNNDIIYQKPKSETIKAKVKASTCSVLQPPKPETKPVPKKKVFKKDDDVLFTADDGTHIFGSVGLVHGDTIQILFGDGTQQLASFDRVKLLSFDDDEEVNDATVSTETETPSCSTSQQPIIVNQSKSKTVVSNGVIAEHFPSVANNTSLLNEEVTCGSCGVVKKVAGKKALNYAPFTSDKFNCRRCLNKSRCCKNNLPISTMLVGSGNRSINKGKTIQASGTTIITSKSLNDPNQRDSENNQSSEECFHCEGKTNYNDRLHCNLCERACHLSCLAMTPTPLEGDRFWDVICSSCGTQNGNTGTSGRTKVFSCRRSISSWSDVAHLVLSCLESQPENSGESFFDLDHHIMPFIDRNIDRLHLPRLYKSSQRENRRMFLYTALSNATLRFLNRKDISNRTTLWAIRESNNHQVYPMRVNVPPSSTQSSSGGVRPQQPTIPVPINQYKHSPRSSDDAKAGFLSASAKWVQSAPLPKMSPGSTGIASSAKATIINSSVLANLPASTTIIKSPIRTATESIAEGGSSRTMGSTGFRNPQVSPKKVSTTDPGTSSSSLSSVVSPSRLMSQSDRIVMKAKRQCHKPLSSLTSDVNFSNFHPNKLKIEANSPPPESNNLKRTKSSSQNSSPTSDKMSFTTPSKRARLSDDAVMEALNSLSPKHSSADTESSSDSSDFKASHTFKPFSESNGIDPVPKTEFSAFIEKKIKTPSPSSKNLIGKAVKSAGITPPGNNKLIEKPSLRIRKPKQLELKDVKQEKLLEDAPGPSHNQPLAKFKKGLAKRQLNQAVMKLKSRGRPLKLKTVLAPPSLVDSTSASALTETDQDGSATSEFTIEQAKVKDLAYYGVGYTISCLPKPPQTEKELKDLHNEVVLTLKSEKIAPPAYWKSELNGANANCYMPWQKSERDLTNPDTYDIAGKWTDDSGKVHYYCEWKDGYGNDFRESDENTGPFYEIDEADVDNANVLLEKLDQMQVEDEPTSVSGSESTIVSSDDPIGGNDSSISITSAAIKASSYAIKFENEKSLLRNSFIITGVANKNAEGFNHNNKNGVEVQTSLDVIDLTDSP